MCGVAWEFAPLEERTREEQVYSRAVGFKAEQESVLSKKKMDTISSFIPIHSI